MIGEFFINGLDAHGYFGIVVRETTLSTLILEPEPLKNAVTNKSATEHGKRVRQEKEPKVDEREVTLPIQIKAKDRADLFDKLTKLKAVLKKRRITITTKYEPDVVYRMDYQSCRQTRSIFRGLATFNLYLNEPDPTNRGLKDKEDSYEDTDI